MARGKDWLEKNHTKMNAQAKATMAFLNVAANRVRIGFPADSPPGIWLDTVFKPSYTACNTAYEDWKDKWSRTPLKTIALRAAEKVFKPNYREAYRLLKGNPLVTDEDLETMMLPKRPDGTRHEAPVATTHPASRALTTELRQITIEFYEDEGMLSRAKPDGQHGAEIRWAILPAPPTHIRELIESSFDTHTPCTLVFDEADRGKTLYYALRWENTVGKKGPFSPILNVVIP
jgi:hypothetical protein